MARKATLLSAAALAATSNHSTLAFTLPRPTANHATSFRSIPPSPASAAAAGATTPKSTTSLYSDTSSTVPEPSTMSASEMITALSSKPITALTPEGFGFSSPAERILKLAKRDNGYYRAKGSASVVDVMEGIEREGKFDVALVFDEDEDGKEKLLGIFTDADYIRLATERATTRNEQESATYLSAPISNFLTPASSLVCVDPTDTASQAVALMTANNLRHTVVLSLCGPNNSYLTGSSVRGVISMQDVLRVIQGDERLSFEKMAKKFPGLADKPIEQMREELKSQANQLASDPETAKKDILRTGTLALSVGSVALFASQSSWLADNSELAMVAIFVLGYVGIIFEEVFEFNKAAVALLMSTGLWVTYADYYGGSTGSASETVLDQLKEQLAEVSDICFFLLAASAIVEVVDAHQGFKVVTNLIQTKSKKGLFWTIGFLTFFLSAILNNLTVTIVMVSLLRKLVPNDDDRRLFGAMVVVAANAGGVWTPIGDVTTTMLWINNQLSTIPTVTELFLPSMVCLVASLAFLVNQVEEDSSLAESNLPPPSPLATRGVVVFWTGIASLLAVPVFSELTGLPPYIAMLTGLGAIWTMTDIIHLGEEDSEMKVPAALSKLDTSGILFFLGILMSIGVLDKSGLLKELAVFLNENLPSQDIIATVIGIASALIDNVPLVAATMGMYDLSEFGTDDKLWQLIALCAGTGGSILVIGSASGVALMGLEKVDFLWYAKKVTVGAAVGYFAGIGAYLLENAVLTGTLLGSAST